MLMEIGFLDLDRDKAKEMQLQVSASKCSFELAGASTWTQIFMCLAPVHNHSYMVNFPTSILLTSGKFFEYLGSKNTWSFWF